MKHKLSTRVLSMLMAIIMMLSLTTSVFAADPPASAEPEVIVEEAAQNSPAPSASPAPGDDPSRLSTVYEGHRIHYIDSKKQPLPKNAELFMNEINEDDVPFYLQRAAHSLGLESCGMYLYFIADPLLEDASTAEILKYEANPDDPEDRMTVEITLLDDAKMTDEEKELRLEELQNIHLEDLRVIQLGAYWDYDTILPHSEENGVIRFEIEKIAPFILFIPDWESAVYIPEEPEPAEVPEEIAAPIEDTGTQQMTEPVDQPSELTPVPEETVSEVPVESTADTQAADIQNPEPASAEEPVEEVYAQTVTASGTDYSVSLTYTSDANIPEGSMFELSELPASGILYDNLTTSVASTLNAEAEEISSVTFVDVDVKKDGDSVSLDAPVNVSIAVDDPADGDTVTQVVALGQQNEVLNPDEGTAGTFSSTTDSLTSTYAIVRITKQATLRTSDDQTWLITVTYDRVSSGIPESAELIVTELKEGDPGYEEYIAQSAALAGADPDALAFAKAFDISFVDKETGEEVQPTGDVSVSIQLLEEEVDENTQIDVVHFGEEVEQLDAAVNGDAIEFGAGGFSVYVVLATVQKKLTASDGNTYLITVNYDTSSGIPKNAELVVNEIKESDVGYEEYIAASADELGTDPASFTFARAFDISLFDPAMGAEFQPAGDVKVSISLLDTDLSEAEELNLLHFGVEVQMVDYALNENTVEFETDGFSVYVITGANVPYTSSNNYVNIQSLTELSGNVNNPVTSGMGYYLSCSRGGGSYFTNSVDTSSNNRYVYKINTDITKAGKWYFESQGTNIYHIYTYINGEKRYMKNDITKANGNGMDLGNSSDATSFELTDTEENNNRFYFRKSDSDKYLQYSNGGTGIRLYRGTGDQPEQRLTNSQITITYADTPNDYYELNGATYSIAFVSGNNTGIGLTNNATAQPVRINGSNKLIDESGTVARWSFENIGGANYTLSTKINGETKYLALDNDGPRISDTSFVFTLNSNSNGNISFKANERYLCANESGFGCSSEDDNVWFILASLESLSWSKAYPIERNSTVTLDDIFRGCEITDITSAEVESLSASDEEILQVDGLTVKNLKTFSEAQTLTLTLKNGMIGTISVILAPLPESSDLNGFLDGNTVFKYVGEDNTHALTEPAVLNQGDSLQLNLSFSEISEGQEGERQMKLLSPMTYTFPEELSVSSVPAFVTLSVQNGEQTQDFPASATFDEGTRILTVTGIYGDQEAVVQASTMASFTVSVTVQPVSVPGEYELGNDMTLSVVKPRNVKVSSFTAGDYDAATGTITYTAIVEADNDLDTDEQDYPVTITDATSGFMSGSYTYTQGNKPEGKPATLVNGTEVESGVETSFTCFPLTIAHMYDGDTITLTYRATPLHGSYDRETQMVSLKNTVMIDNNGNPSNDPDDDTASVTAGSVSYKPLTREYVTLDGSWAYWKVTVNPNGYTLNDGNSLTLADTFDDKMIGDAEQSIDYASIEITSAGNVTYDYSGSTGTFVIPDNTPVTITYRTRITAQPGQAALFRGTARLRDDAKNLIDEDTAGVTKDPVPIYPSPSDVTGSDYMVKLYVYADGQMQTGIPGAQFILLDANQRPLEYSEGQPITFTTGSDGYVDIKLDQDSVGISIEKNTGYYLEMMHAFTGYQKDNTLYSFMITDDPAYETGGFYQYYNGDTMKVRLYPATPGLSVSIRFSGSYALREDQQNEVTAVLQKLDENDNWVEVESHPYTDSQWGAITFSEKLFDETLAYQNFYRVVVENENPWDLPEYIHVETTYYSMVNTDSSDPYKKPQEFSVTNANDSVNVVIDNRYEDPQLTIVKMDKSTGDVLPGTIFEVYKIVEGKATGDAVTSYTTDASGEIVIRGGGAFQSETLYGIKETEAPTDYLLPLNAEWHYFYFCNDDYLEPSILANLPQGATAINLTSNGDRITIGNQKQLITVPVMKLWQGNAWPEPKIEEIEEVEVVVGLYRAVEGVKGEPEAVLNEDGTRLQVTLNSTMPYNNVAFTNLPSRDGENRNYIYSIKEEYINGIVPTPEEKDGVLPLDAGYNQEYGISSAGAYIVRNKPATTLTVSKEWYDLAGNRIEGEELAAQSSVTFDVYRSSTPFEDSDPDDGVTNADMTAFVSNLTKVREKLSFGASDNWTMSIPDLDKQDDFGNPYYYYVLESIPSFGNELYVLDEEKGTITIQNKIAPNTVNLTVTKAALVDDPRPGSLDRDFNFTLKLMADDTHPVRSWQVYTDPEDEGKKLVTDWNGEVEFTLKPTDPDHQPTEGASITLSLPAGVTATVTEAYNPEYTVETSTDGGATKISGRTFSYDTIVGVNATVTYINMLHVVCKVVPDGEGSTPVPFETLSRALSYIREHSDSFTSPWTIYMLEDYTIPSTDGIDLAEGESLILTTASKTDTLFPFKPGIERDRAVITRGEAGDSVLKNAGTLTLNNICLDGGNPNDGSITITATGDGGLVYSAGILNLNPDTTLRNSASDGKGGAVYAKGTVNIVDGVELTGNSASSASALYLSGTLNMTGGRITGNSGASNGAVVVESTIDRIKLSRSPVIDNNTNTQGKAANLYIGVDSDNVVDVIAPGLAESARIGVTATEGHMLIGEQFATAEFEQTENLGCFVNDVYGYRGKLKDGTSINIVWDGLTIKIKKAVDPVGANPNDRFTITLSSMSIVMNTYIIEGTLDYSVSTARQGRPGRIILNNVKNEDEITISPLPVGEYTITENASNYAPTYTIVETESGKTPEEIVDGSFDAENNSTITVTNTRRLADVKLTKTLDDRLKTAEETQSFNFTVKLTEADGTAIAGFPLVTDDEGTPDEDFITDENGEVAFTMSPTNAAAAIREFRAPVGATMTVTETDDPNYKITASAKTMPKEGEGTTITDEDTDNDNIFAFTVTDDGANVTFANVRKMAEIELRKNLVGKVSATESFTFTVTLTRADGQPAANYIMYRDDGDQENNITTGEDGKATIIFSIGKDEVTKAIPLTIPEGTKLEVAETEIKRIIGGSEQAIYNTKYSINGAAEKTGLTATINNVSDNDHSIVFNNTRKMNTIVVKNTVAGYSGNVVPFTYTASVTDWSEEGTKPEEYDDYDANDFTDGVMSFELATGQTRTLTVPYGATLTVTEIFIVGYSTTVKRGSAAAVEKLSDSFVVTTNMSSSSPLLFTNSQLIGLRLVNNTSSTLENVTITVGKNNIYLVNEDRTGQERISTNKTAKISIGAGKTAILEIQHDTNATAEQNYSVKGTTPADGYYYTIINEPSFHETANPAILRVYDAAAFEVKGKLRYSVADSTVTFTAQPLVSFDSNDGAWTTEMDGYRDRDGDRKVYQKAVDSGKTVERPTPDPVYPTAEEIAFLGWTIDETFAKQAHTESEDVSAKLYDFENTPVNEPLTLYAVWAHDPSVRTVTVKNALNTELTVTVTLTNADPSGANYTLYEDTSDPANSITTDENGTASFTLAANEPKNLKVPNGAKLVISGSAGIAYSTDFTDDGSTAGSFTIDPVDKDGTVSFIGGRFKITDEAGNVLYDANGKPAVFWDLKKINDADPDGAFDAYVKPLYTYDNYTTPATPAAVKQLVDEYTIPNTSAIVFPNANMMLTTAGKNDADFPYVGVRDRSTIYRSATGIDNSCFTFANGTVTLTDIILDGASERGVKVNDGKNGALINITGAEATLNISTGATLRNVEYTAYTSNANGGAIYMTNGTLNVNAGLFSNLHAYQGGAICVTGGTLNVTGTAGSTQFEDCRSERQDGGAIYYNKAQDLLINGGTDKENPGIIFTRCVAAYNNGDADASDGGAIFATSNYTNTVTVKGCSFIECSARSGNKQSTSGYGGGGICGFRVKELTVEACTFESCDTLCGGGAVAAIVKYTDTVDNETVTINNCSFDSCNCKSQGGALAIYQDNNGATNSATKLSVIGYSTFTNCSSGTNNGSGGAIQCYLPCMVFNNSDFTDCWAGKEGGAINNFFAGKYGDMWSKSSLTVTDCTFTRCRAEDRYQADQMPHYGGAINTKVKRVSVTGSTFTDCVSTLREGGALHLGGIGDLSTATITGSTFKNCMAKTSGGAVMASTETLTVSDSFFYGCQAFGVPASNYIYDNANKRNQNGGGAISHSENSRNTSTQETTTITNCVFSADPNGGEGAKSCSTVTNGGAIWTRAETVNIEQCTIDGCTANGNGGGIYLSKNGSQNATISGTKAEETIKGTITDCQAVSGSAVYVEDKATFSGYLEVSGNTVSGENSGAIQTVDAGKLYFEGNVKVENNTCSDDSANNHDVLMQIDGNTIINTTNDGLDVGAKIGVYVPGIDSDNFYGRHGKYGQPFGTYINSDKGSRFLDAFFNDRDSELYGYQGAEDDHPIRWGFYVCKITDEDGNTLKRPNGRDAVYQTLSQAIVDFTSVKNENGEIGKAVYIKMLVEDYAIRQEAAISNFPVADITLTTETYTGPTPVEGEYDGKHPYRGTEGTVCTIYRTNSENPLFSMDTANAVFQLKDITLDGRKDKTAAEGDYKLITATTGTIIVNSGTTLQYAKGDTGAAISGASVTIKGSYDAEKKEPTVKITNCTATGSGGAISTQNLTITNTSTTQGEYGTVFTDCSSGAGGAIYASGMKVTMVGASFTDCHSTGEGGILFHDKTSAVTEIENCTFKNVYTENGAGGAVSSKADVLKVKDASFDACAATGNGGAISHTGSTRTELNDCTFDACRTTGSGFGGSVYTGAKEVTLNGGSFENSTAANHGGALYCASSAADSAATVSGTSFVNCATTLDIDDNNKGCGGAIYSKTKALTLQGYTPEGSTAKTATTINACKAPGFSGAVYMETVGSTLDVKDSTVISNCYANQGGAIYLPAGVTMNITDSPEFTQNGYTTRNGSVVNATAGACIYLAEGSRINMKDSPKFSRNILPNLERITNGGVLDNVRQDIYLAGYASDNPNDTNAASIYVVGELTGDTIWVWPEQNPHKKPNKQFAKIDLGDETLSAVSLANTLGHLRNALKDGRDTELDDDHTECDNGEHLAGVQVGTDYENVYWDKMYAVSFAKKDNKGVRVPGAGFTLYKDPDCSQEVATAFSSNEKGTVEFTSVRIGAYYMRETTVPTSFKDNNTTYLVLVGTPYLSPNESNKNLWEGDGPLNVKNAPTLVQRYTINAGKYYGIFSLDENNKAKLDKSHASSNVGIQNIRNDYQAAFMKVDSNGNPLPGAAFTIYTAIPDAQHSTYEDGYPKLMPWSRDGETYPAPVVSADGTSAYKDIDNNPLPKGVVYFRELPLGTYYLLETAYPERNGDGRRTYYLESDRVFKLDIAEAEGSTSAGEITVTLSEWKPTEEDPTNYDVLPHPGDYYVVSNQEVVCKLTDANDKLLYVKGHKVRDKESQEYARLFPAIYTTLEEGFADAQEGSFVYNNQDSANVDTVKLKVLKDFTLSTPLEVNSSRAITFTTAETRVSKDRYIFSTTRTQDTSYAIITRGYSEDDPALDESGAPVLDEFGNPVAWNDGNANEGALITLINGADGKGADMTLQNIILDGQKAKYNGRAMHVTDGSSLTILNNTRIENFMQAAAADSADTNSVQGGAILMDDGTNLSIDGGYNKTAIFSKNTIANNRTTGEYTGSDGGAIAVGDNCTFSITNAQFTGNTAQGMQGNGGALSINRIIASDDLLNKPRMKNVVFSNNSASYQGGAIQIVEGVSLTVENSTFQRNTATTGDGGAIAVLSNQDSPSALTISGGSFTGNTATSGGAVKIGGFGTLTLTGNVTMSGNSAAYGGAVNVAPGANATFSNGTVSGNNASVYGGAFYVDSITENADGSTDGSTEGSTDGNTQTVSAGTLTITGGSITSNSAVEGSAVYANDYAEITVSGGNITGNTASGTDGGAINVGGENAKLYFGGSPVVFDNTVGNQQKNVVLSVDSNNVICTTENGITGGLVGVYVTGALTDDQFTEHGLPGKPFGTFGDSARANPNVFRNDRALNLTGTRSTETDNAIYWNDVLCKLTNSNDVLLYKDETISVNGRNMTLKVPAVYTSIQDGFNAAQGTLSLRGYDKDGNIVYTEYKSGNFNLNDIKLKMLRDATLSHEIMFEEDAYGILYRGERRVIFTTAETVIEDYMLSSDDCFTFATTRKDSNGNMLNTALIKRNFEALSMLYVMGSRLTLTDIVLDGAGADNTSALGGISLVTENSELVINQGAVLQNSRTILSGGAVHVRSGGALTMNGGTIIGNTSELFGGAVYVDPNGTMTMTGGSISGNTVNASTLFEDFEIRGGAGIYLASDGNKAAVLNLSGNPVFNNNFVVVANDGAGGTEAISSKTNGGQEVYSGSRVRQDIFMTGTGAPLTSIRLKGNLTTKDEGYIWVWPQGGTEEENHYKMQKQFAVLAKDFSGTVTDTTCKAFRNARPDDVTGCTGEYLFGQNGDPVNGYQCIYWTGVTGSRRVILRKVMESGGSFSTPTSSYTFKIYSNEACTNLASMIVRDAQGKPSSQKFNDDGLVAAANSSGVFFIGELAYGTYYVKEGGVDKTFVVTVDADGAGKLLEINPETGKSIFSKEVKP